MKVVHSGRWGLFGFFGQNIFVEGYKMNCVLWPWVCFLGGKLCCEKCKFNGIETYNIVSAPKLSAFKIKHISESQHFILTLSK